MQINHHSTAPSITGEDSARLTLFTDATSIQHNGLVATLINDDDLAIQLTFTCDETAQIHTLLQAFLHGKNRHSRNSNVTPLTLITSDGVSLTLMYDNRGEPFRQGISFEVKSKGQTDSVFFDEYAIMDLSQILTELPWASMPETPAKSVTARISTEPAPDLHGMPRWSTVVDTALAPEYFIDPASREDARLTLQRCYSALWGESQVTVLFDDEEQEDRHV